MSQTTAIAMAMKTLAIVMNWMMSPQSRTACGRLGRRRVARTRTAHVLEEEPGGVANLGVLLEKRRQRRVRSEIGLVPHQRRVGCGGPGRRPGAASEAAPRAARASPARPGPGPGRSGWPGRSGRHRGLLLAPAGGGRVGRTAESPATRAITAKPCVWRIGLCDSSPIYYGAEPPWLTVAYQGALPLGPPDTLSRAPLRRRAPFAWARSLRSLTLVNRGSAAARCRPAAALPAGTPRARPARCAGSPRGRRARPGR